jgi:catechol 2,3-dioxygenase-like lactoylglutathione lyase family enzyme
MLLKKVVYVAQFVSDQDKALDFYTRRLEFEKRADNPTPDGPRFVTVGVKGQDFQLVLWPGRPGEGQSVDGRIPATCTIETPDCRKAFEELKSRESGTGKEVVARLIHRASARKGGPFVALNCAALPEQLESELFGYERGAFTGAQQAKPGQIELAAGGVLFPR